MSRMRCVTVLILSCAVLFNSTPIGLACGPDPITPIFVFGNSPDPPFEEFTRGKLGIVRPKMGRKTLFIAYRYLNGGSFTGQEQRDLVDALRGKAPEDNGEDAITAWIKARRDSGIVDDTFPAISIYKERENGGYDFFPNCTRSGFETAVETLNDRIASHGADNPHVRVWLAAQDRVFQNCADGSGNLQQSGPEDPEWLRKDRDYQIGAAYFYSLKFDEAREQFERIAADNNSPWRQTADYLVARTLVRHASLSQDAKTKRSLYEKAERHLQLLLGTGGKFQAASQKLLNLVTYRLHPEERVVQLGRTLSFQNGNENLSQDLIDYVWLLDKFNAKVNDEILKKREALKGEKKEEYRPDPKDAARFEAVMNGELIEIYFYPQTADGKPDYGTQVRLTLKPETSEDEVLEQIAESLGRELTPQEIKEAKEQHKRSLEHRDWLRAPNRALSKIVDNEYDGSAYYDYVSEKPELEMFPEFLRKDELSDWILTFQITDLKAYTHALSKWRESDSVVWLVTALAKAERTSANLEQLLQRAAIVPRDSAAYSTILYHVIRLNIALGKKSEARKLLEEGLLISDLMPVSAQNEFRELGLQLAANRTEFLKFGQRKPASFYKFGRYGSISALLAIEKTMWNPEYTKQTKEDFEIEIEASYKDLLDYDNRYIFEEKTTDVFNWHIAVDELAEVGRDPALPDYLRLRVLLTVWTRAFLLKNERTARKVAAEIVALSPALEATFSPYLAARTIEERGRAALYILLRSPSLSPYLDSGVFAFSTSEENNYYFETSWWCRLSETDYDADYNEIPKVVAKPGFLTPLQLDAARRQRAILLGIGNAKPYLGDLTLAWANKSPLDLRLPEALFIVAEANRSYKYGCGGWEADEGIVEKAERLLRSRYPDSPWTAKLRAPEQ